MVVYLEGEVPQQDFLLRGGGPGNRKIMVVAVTEHGKAATAGVKAGDVLSSIDGRKDFAGLPADMVHASLDPPVTLVFLGFIGKLQAEVRLNYKQKSCGMSSRQQVTLGRGTECVELTDEVVFTPLTPRDAVIDDDFAGPRGLASLFLATNIGRKRHQSTNLRSIPGGDEDSLVEDGVSERNDETHSLTPSPSAGREMFDGEGASEPSGSGELSGSLVNGTRRPRASSKDGPTLSPRFYELNGGEARTLLTRALTRIQGHPSPRRPGSLGHLFPPHIGPGQDTGQVLAVQAVGVMSVRSGRPKLPDRPDGHDRTTARQEARGVYLGGDHAQAPRSILPASSPFAVRMDAKRPGSRDTQGVATPVHFMPPPTTPSPRFESTPIMSKGDVCTNGWMENNCEQAIPI